MTQTDPKLVAEIDAIEDDIIDAPIGLESGAGGGGEPAGGPYKPTDDPLLQPMGGPLLQPMGGPYKPTGDPETNGGPYKPTTDEPAAATPTQ